MANSKATAPITQYNIAFIYYLLRYHIISIANCIDTFTKSSHFFIFFLDILARSLTLNTPQPYSVMMLTKIIEKHL